MICDNISVNDKGNLTFAGRDTVELAKKYGTPLYLMDEEKIRQHVRTYKTAMEEFLPQGSCPEFASKAFSVKQIYRIMNEEGIDIDVVSCGEIYTAMTAGFPLERAFFHGNNKTDFDIRFAIENGIGYFVADGIEELLAIDETAGGMGKVQNVLLRATPGIDPHTHKKISTGSTESKFGMSIETGDAKLFVKTASKLKNICVCGYHCHIGSQIFSSDPFETAIKIMVDFIAECEKEYGIGCNILNLGGGLGVRYTESDPEIDYAEKIKEMSVHLNRICNESNVSVPIIHLEPGRSLVADAGMTLYTVGSVKEIEGYKNYVSVDGGMTDNPRYTLYEAEHSMLVANKAECEKNFVATVAGRCCESGDLIGEDVKMAKPERGDILAVMTTGAYNYSMASNYNRVPRPPVVMLNKDGEYIAVKRETLEDIVRLDV